MAEGQRMTAADVVAQVRDGRLEDFVREAVVLVARELMEAEISEQVGAELGEVAPAGRVTHRNGYRPRPWETRVGEIELLIPRVRQGSYFPSFLEPRRRSEQAIVAVVLEAYVNGVSTRKVDRLVEQLGIEGMTKDRVSAMCRTLDEQVELFRQRPLEGAYPYLWLDAKHVKVRDHGRSRQQSAGRRLCGARDRAAGGDRHRHRRGRVRQLLGRVPARPEETRPDRRQAGGL
jgi:putative transposase